MRLAGVTQEGVAAHHLRMPHAEPGMAIGLLGGSFAPPHEGHLMVAQTALKALRLDRLWWIVTPGNPLKAGGAAMPLAERIARSQALARDPRIVVTALEAGLAVNLTADMIAHVQARCRGVRFVWIMGADNLATFHLWGRWRGITTRVPIAVVDRPGATFAALSSIAARSLARHRIPQADAARLARLRPPAWTFIHGPRSALSSSAIRAAVS